MLSTQDRWDEDSLAVRQGPARFHLTRAIRRHPWIALFLLAFSVRALAALVIYVHYHGSLFLDDATYSDMAAAKAHGETGAWDPYTSWLYNRTATLLVPMTLLYKVFGPVRLVGQLLVALFGAATAVLAARTAYEVVDPRAAGFVGVGIALLPSQILFSSTTMKDALVWCLLAVLALLIALAGRWTGRRLVAAGVGIFAAVLLLGYLRLHTQLVAALALALCALLIRPAARRGTVVACALFVLLFAPWIAGSGPAGYHLLSGADPQELNAIRQSQSIGGSAFVHHPGPGAPSHGQPATGSSDTGSGTATLAYLPRGVTRILLGPFPWSGSGSSLFRLAALENLAWYAVLGLAAYGGRRLWAMRRVSLFPLVAGSGCLFMWALVEGNAGAAFRHRGELVWAGFVLAGIGVQAVLDRRRTRESHA